MGCEQGHDPALLEAREQARGAGPIASFHDGRDRFEPTIHKHVQEDEHRHRSRDEDEPGREIGNCQGKNEERNRKAHPQNDAPDGTPAPPPELTRNIYSEIAPRKRSRHGPQIPGLPTRRKDPAAPAPPVRSACRPCYNPWVVHPAADVAQLIQRRELAAYEQRLARAAYAYGVDLRRGAWLEGSTLGDPVMRAVDRGWNALVADLSGSILQDARRSAPLSVMEELGRLIRLLRAPLPTLRLLVRGISRDAWPIVTPLGTTKGALHWLILDAERLIALPKYEQSFLLGAALSHFQCDHGPVITAHLMADRAERGLTLVRTLARPWTSVGVFSADRAGLIACGELEPAIAALRAHHDGGPRWLPGRPALALRERALVDFDRSRVMTRLRLLSQRREAFTIGPPAATPQPAEQAESTPNSDSNPAAPPSSPPIEAKPTNGSPYRAAAPQPPAPEPANPDEELIRALAQAWSLARCDARLTRRLGLL